MLSEKILFLIASTLFLQLAASLGPSKDEATELHVNSQMNQIRGLPELDYPTYYVIPKTSFRCSDQLYNPGFYADTETRCQAFHLCYEHRQESFLCPMGTIFNQPILACDYWYSSNCSLAPSYYHVNADKRNEEYHDEVNDPIDRQSDDLFDKMAHLYEIDQPSNSPVLKNPDISEIEVLGRDGVESSGETFNEGDKAGDYNKYGYDNQFNMVEHPEFVEYEVRGLDDLNIHKNENEQLYEEDAKDFIFSEDGMLHPTQDVYEMNPTDQNFDQEHSGYAEIPSKGDFNYDLNEDLDLLSSEQVSDFELQKRNADVSGGYFRRPLNRKPVVVIPEEPEIVELPVIKHKRKPIRIASTVSTNADHESKYEADNDSIYEEVADEDLKDTTLVEFPQDKLNSDLYAYELTDPKLFYEIQEENSDEDDSQLHQEDSLDEVYRLSNNEETSSDALGSGSHDLLSISNVDHGNIIADSSYGDESEIFIENFKDSTELADRNSETTTEDEISFDSDPFLGSGSEKNVNPSIPSDEISFPEYPYIFADSEDAEIDSEKSDELPLNLLDTLEGSGIYVQEADGKPDFIEEANEPMQFILDDSDGTIYGKESSFSSETFGSFSPLANNERAPLVPDGSGGTGEFNYMLHESQVTSDDSQYASDEKIPGIDGSNVLSDSEHNYNSNYEYDDSNGFYSKNLDFPVNSNFKDGSDETFEDLIVNDESLHVPSDLKSTNNIENDTQHKGEYQDSKRLEHVYEKLSDEFEAETPADNEIDSDSDGNLSTDELKHLEIVPQNQSHMLKNLFDVSNEKSISDDIKDGIISPTQNIDEQDANPEASDSMEREHEFENVSVDSSSNNEHNSVAEQMEQVSNVDGSDQGESETFLPQQEWEFFVSGKETESFNSLSAESDEMLSDGPVNKQKLPLKIPIIKPKNDVVNENMKKVERGKRFNDNLQMFNPINTGNLMVPSRETFRESMFTNIPSTFLKMKHSTLRPYFYNYGLQNSGFNPRTGDIFESSKLSKLTSLGKRLLTAKKAKFNIMKKYVDSYRNN